MFSQTKPMGWVPIPPPQGWSRSGESSSDRKDIAKGETSNASEDTRRDCNLIVNYLPQTLSDEEFYTLFASKGPIKYCRIVRDLKTGYSFGYGFVEYTCKSDADKAVKELNSFSIGRKKIKVAVARSGGDKIKDTNLYIQNIPRDYEVEQLEALFAQYGNIVSKSLLKDRITGMPRGVGFIRYSTKEEADAAMNALDGHIPEGGTEPLIVKVAEDHSKMKAAYYAGFMSGTKIKGRMVSGGAERVQKSVINAGLQIAKPYYDRSITRFNPLRGGRGRGFAARLYDRITGGVPEGIWEDGGPPDMGRALDGTNYMHNQFSRRKSYW